MEGIGRKGQMEMGNRLGKTLKCCANKIVYPRSERLVVKIQAVRQARKDMCREPVGILKGRFKEHGKQ